MVAPPPAGEEALQENDQGFEEQDLDQGFGQHFLITDTSGSLLPLKNTSNSSSSTPKVLYRLIFTLAIKQKFKFQCCSFRCNEFPKQGQVARHYPPLVALFEAPETFLARTAVECSAPTATRRGTRGNTATNSSPCQAGKPNNTNQRRIDGKTSGRTRWLQNTGLCSTTQSNLMEGGTPMSLSGLHRDIREVGSCEKASYLQSWCGQPSTMA